MCVCVCVCFHHTNNLWLRTFLSTFLFLSENRFFRWESRITRRIRVWRWSTQHYLIRVLNLELLRCCFILFQQFIDGKKRVLKHEDKWWRYRKLMQEHLLVQVILMQKLLNVIILGQTQCDNINRMITVANEIYLLIQSKWDFGMWSH